MNVWQKWFWLCAEARIVIESRCRHCNESWLFSKNEQFKAKRVK